MSNYVWLLTVKVGDALRIASIQNSAPDPGDLVELEDGTLAVIVMRSIYSGSADAEYQKSVAIATPVKVVAYYNRRAVEEESNDPS